ncbi:transcription elongation factor Elf1 like-domain-containing protein [Zopfochytrium polystomum]|nr:transcription elongation factor Elf1 like-domain-containing protein [Zopfochytrium polystomum]
MGKRKSSRKVVKKARPKLDKDFACLFCNHDRSILTTLDRENQVGKLECKKCGVNFQTPINYLSEPIDVYSDWVDACEATNKQAAKQQTRRNSGGSDDDVGGGRGGGRGAAVATADDYDDDLDDDY